MSGYEEFKASIVAFAKRSLNVVDRCKNEEGAKLFLVLPFVSLLGYDDRDPSEVWPERHADFAEKYANRVDYAIMRGDDPIIAVECKAFGVSRVDDRGQLKRYFNAEKTVKLGVLTDGMVYEFFVDSAEPNLMDDIPFMTLDLKAVAGGQLTDSLVKGLYALTKTQYDPSTVSESARLGLVYKEFYGYLQREIDNPGEELTRFLLTQNGVKNIRSTALKTYQDLARNAMKDVFAHHVMKKLDIEGISKPSSNPVEIPTAPASTAPTASERSEAEDRVLDYIRRRLAFLVAGDQELYDCIDRISAKDYQGKLVVFLDMERKGRIVDFIEPKNGAPMKFLFVDDPTPIETHDMKVLDERLVAGFRRSVAAIG